MNRKVRELGQAISFVLQFNRIHETREDWDGPERGFVTRSSLDWRPGPDVWKPLVFPSCCGLQTRAP